MKTGWVALSLFLLAGAAHAQVIERVNVTTGGAETVGAVSNAPVISSDARFVAFVFFGSNLVAGDTNGVQDVFVRDRTLGITTRVSVSTAGAEANVGCDSPSISSDGRFVAFQSPASNLVAGDTNGARDIFVHDRTTATTVRVSVDSMGGESVGGASGSPAISADGRFVVFFTSATTILTAADTNGINDVFVHDRQTGATTRVSVDSAGTQGTGGASDSGGNSQISADGRFIAFYSDMTNLVAGDTNGFQDVFVHDRTTGVTTRVSVDSTGAQSVGGGSFVFSISSDGRFVVFRSDATNLVAGDTNGLTDNFVHDRLTGTTTRESVDSAGGQAIGGGSSEGSISDDGRYVAFTSAATNLVAGDTNGFQDVFVRDRTTGLIVRASVDSTGAEAVGGLSAIGRMTLDGRFVVLQSNATNLVAGDTNGFRDIFVASNSIFAPLQAPAAAAAVDDDGDDEGPCGMSRFSSCGSSGGPAWIALLLCLWLLACRSN